MRLLVDEGWETELTWYLLDRAELVLEPNRWDESERKKLELAAKVDASRLVRHFALLKEEADQLKRLPNMRDNLRIARFNERLNDPFGEGSLYWKVEQSLASKQEQ